MGHVVQNFLDGDRMGMGYVTAAELGDGGVRTDGSGMLIWGFGILFNGGLTCGS